MRSDHRLIISTLMIVLALIFVSGCKKTESGEPAAPQPDDQTVDSAAKPVSLGVILPLTGDAAVYGKALRNGIELARSEIEEANGVTLSLIYEDDRGQATTAVSAVRKLIDVHKVPAIIGGAQSSTAEAINPICERANVVLLSPTATKPSLTRTGSYFLRIWPSDEYDGKVLAESAYNKLNARRASILYVNVAYGVGITTVFEREFSKLGGDIISKEGYGQGETNFRTHLTKIKNADPDVVFLPGYVAEVTQILKQATELQLDARFLGGETFHDANLLEIAGTAAEGAVFTYQTFDAKGGGEIVRSFVDAYTNEYGEEPDAFAVQGYDALHVMARAMAGTASNGPQILEALHNLGRIEGAGGSFEFDANGDVEKPIQLYIVRSGTFEPFE